MFYEFADRPTYEDEDVEDVEEYHCCYKCSRMYSEDAFVFEQGKCIHCADQEEDL